MAEMPRNNSYIVVLCVPFRKGEYHYFHNTYSDVPEVPQKNTACQRVVIGANSSPIGNPNLGCGEEGSVRTAQL